MAINFSIPPWRKAQIKKKMNRKERASKMALEQVGAFLEKAVSRVVDYGYHSGDFHAPNLEELYRISERFYRNVIESAFDDSEEQKEGQKGKRRLAKWPIGIPRRSKRFADLFKNDSIYWQRVLKRSRIMTDRMKKIYLKNLEAKFKDLVPAMTSGAISPREVKTELVKAWGTTKARVETIFRTETTTYFEKAQLEFFRGDKDIIGYLFDSIHDSSCTEICKSRHGMIFKEEYSGANSIGYNTPPLHFNCRSHWIPLADTPENQKMAKDKRRDPTTHKLAPLPEGWR